jgi:proline iminopeptidase
VSVLPGARPDPRYTDPKFRLAFARLVTHYWAHAAWLEDGALLRGASRLDGIPGTLVHGRLDVSSPLDSAWSLSRAWRGSELVVVDAAGHGAVHEGIRAAVLDALERFAIRGARGFDIP